MLKKAKRVAADAAFRIPKSTLPPPAEQVDAATVKRCIEVVEGMTVQPASSVTEGVIGQVVAALRGLLA